jgi:hypothetical protein
VRTTDIAIFGSIVVTFAVLLTAHLCIVVGLFLRQEKWRSIAALFLLPLAPYWALRDRMYVRGAAWLIAAITYSVARGLAT